MKAEFVPTPYQYRKALLTYEAETYRSDIGPCTIRIYRHIGNDNRTSTEHTLNVLKRKEPHVGAWPGDIIEYWQYDTLVHTIRY
jgi:hypothetical protein